MVRSLAGVGHPRQADFFQQRLRALEARRGRKRRAVAAVHRADGDVLAHAQAREGLDHLKRARDAQPADVVRRHVRDRAAAVLHLRLLPV
jgi:hypothetical protein